LLKTRIAVIGVSLVGRRAVQPVPLRLPGEAVPVKKSHLVPVSLTFPWHNICRSRHVDWWLSHPPRNSGHHHLSPLLMRRYHNADRLPTGYCAQSECPVRCVLSERFRSVLTLRQNIGTKFQRKHVNPPSATNAVPVMTEDSSDARNRTALAISPTSAMRLIK